MNSFWAHKVYHSKNWVIPLRRPILKNYLTLMVSSLGVWLAMFANRAIIVRLAGAEALGLYQMVFPAYRLIATIVTIGLPTVLTTLVADYISRGTAEEAERIRRIAAAVIFVLSIGASILLWSLRDWLA
ncbi:MAG TPA: hypothetical protein DCX37_10680, partial [Firmicutes bacterium]|nr:hypothetical protein [Bacillota bacterium]